MITLKELTVPIIWKSRRMIRAWSSRVMTSTQLHSPRNQLLKWPPKQHLHQMMERRKLRLWSNQIAQRVVNYSDLIKLIFELFNGNHYVKMV